MIAALVLGRKGSVGYPNKNVAPVLGRPLSLYPILAAKASAYIDQVYLSTDDERLMKIAKDNGVEVIERPAYLCTKEALGEDAYVHGYQEIIKLNPGKQIELMVLLFCNAATFLPKHIDEGIKAMQKNGELDSAVTVSQYNWYSPVRARRIAKDGLLQPFIPFECYENYLGTINCDRDAQGDCWFADVCVSVVRPYNLEHIHEGLLPQKWMGKKIYPIINVGGLDVDKEFQMPQVEFWLRNNGFTEERLHYATRK
jgi:hypothetical protein